MQHLINQKATYEKIKPLDQYLVLSKMNWPPCPGYYPNIMAIVASNKAGIDDKDTLAIICQHLTCEYWRQRVVDWREFSVLGSRLAYVEKSIEAYISRDYVQAIYVLLPQFEGVINGYIQSQLGQQPRRKFQENLQIFREAVTTRRLMLYPKRMLDIILEFIESGTFWAQSKTVADPRMEINRHGALHGAFVGFESQEIALKYLTLMDGLSMVLLHDMMLTKDI